MMQDQNKNVDDAARLSRVPSDRLCAGRVLYNYSLQIFPNCAFRSGVVVVHVVVVACDRTDHVCMYVGTEVYVCIPSNNTLPVV